MGSLFKESPHLSWSSLQDATPSGDVDLSVVWLIILSAAMTDKEKEAALDSLFQRAAEQNVPVPELVKNLIEGARLAGENEFAEGLAAFWLSHTTDN
jgi:hypothetical protein